jgi:hypothetical protein
MDNWDSLATGPIKPDKPFDGLELYDAPASSMIAGGVKCRIMRTINSFAETLTYGCNIPVTDSVVNDSDIALKAFVAPWRSCVAGWEEVPAPRPKPLDAEIMLSEIMFSEGEKALSFSTSIKPIRYDNIGLIKVKIKR